MLDESSVQQQAEACRASGPYHIIIDATGALTMDGVGPEKSLASLREDTLMKNFHINAVAPVLALRHFAPLLASGPSVYAKLSARVGSISDNTKGGWYGYRASKAALNQLVRTAAIELKRRRPAAVCVALHPGTVRTALSSPFSKDGLEVQMPETSAARLLGVIDDLNADQSGGFFDHLGVAIAW
jgi:NAD(P)-dependent dehydrogenase (short-subunit alcohol dehydrogenase family)